MGRGGKIEFGIWQNIQYIIMEANIIGGESGGGKDGCNLASHVWRLFLESVFNIVDKSGRWIRAARQMAS